MNRQTRLNCVQPLNDAWRSLLLYLYSAAVAVIPNDYGRYIAQAMLVATRASLTTVAIPSPTSVKRTRTSAASMRDSTSVRRFTAHCGRHDYTIISSAHTHLLPTVAYIQAFD